MESLGADTHVQGVDLGRSRPPWGCVFPGLPQSQEDEPEPEGKGFFGDQSPGGNLGAPLKALPTDRGACGPAGCGGNWGEEGRQKAGTASLRSLAEKLERGGAGWGASVTEGLL